MGKIELLVFKPHVAIESMLLAGWVMAKARLR